MRFLLRRNDKKNETKRKICLSEVFCHSDEGGITSSKPKTKRKICLSNAGGNT
ncbi:hypothetical protein O8E88_001893 [Flavobacterium psychrophilum]|uniref:hypothetical protein n=1 Tax=Flavobacterium psychrophilum TaxID=96345 RepID=UPI0008763627|nr:hypothetical protein [Flavobacterium psychrophilum]EKT2070078.1 hypothetical protein [Flavobacterium psychrophilum]EKT4491639.1 hypothetical protein [Flavobacterium psychrophilum]SCY03691.1 hypothetical protein SAMN02745938_10686 [Flavobacterium psychrophilum DSM 3660] [Flavobacterium psychrophilum DSM 3660 = ATCC 49418]